MRSALTASTVALLCASAFAGTTVVSNYDDLTEGFLGTSFTYNGIHYSNANNVGGVFPNGDTFTPGDIGDQFIIERATLLYNDFPGWGSAHNALTFGTAFIPGDNLSLGAFAQATLTLENVANAAEIQMVFFEDGPWGGIEFHMDALRNGQVVASDSFTVFGVDPEMRDRIAFDSLSVSGAEFDTIYLSATFNGQFSAPRLMLDDVAITYVPAPAAAAPLCFAGAFFARRRR